MEKKRRLRAEKRNYPTEKFVYNANFHETIKKMQRKCKKVRETLDEPWRISYNLGNSVRAKIGAAERQTYCIFRSNKQFCAYVAVIALAKQNILCKAQRGKAFAFFVLIFFLRRKTQ